MHDAKNRLRLKTEHIIQSTPMVTVILLMFFVNLLLKYTNGFLNQFNVDKLGVRKIYT